MKRIIILMLALMSASAVFGQQKVAVFVTGEQDAGINKVLGDQLVAAFVESGKYTAIERTGTVDDKELSRLGMQFGVQLVCVAEVKDVFGQKYISAQLINVESAQVIHSANAVSSSNSMDELMKAIKSIAKVLTGETAKE